MLAETNPFACAMSCPVLTAAPFSTTGVAGAPMCCETGTVTCAGTGRITVGLSAVSLFSGGWIPPFGNVFNTFMVIFRLFGKFSFSVSRSAFCIFGLICAPGIS